VAKRMLQVADNFLHGCFSQQVKTSFFQNKDIHWAGNQISFNLYLDFITNVMKCDECDDCDEDESNFWNMPDNDEHVKKTLRVILVKNKLGSYVAK
jgi:hypothetical protein